MRRSRCLVSVLLGGMAIGSVTVIGVLRAAPQPAAGKLPDLLQARVDTAAESRKLAERQFEQGTATFEDVLTWSRREIEAKLDLATTKADRIALLEGYVELARRGEAIAAKRAAAAVASPLDLQSARYERLGAEVRLARARNE